MDGEMVGQPLRRDGSITRHELVEGLISFDGDQNETCTDTKHTTGGHGAIGLERAIMRDTHPPWQVVVGGPACGTVFVRIHG